MSDCDGPDLTYKPDRRFQWVGTNSRRIRCTICGKSGLPGGRWMDGCRRGHAPCRNGCGKVFTVLRDGTARAHPGAGCVEARVPARHIIVSLAKTYDLPLDVVAERIDRALRSPE